MNQDRKLQIAFLIGIALVLLGTLNPLHGSLLILAGSLILMEVTRRYKDPHAKYYRMAAGAIIFGVAALWILYALGLASEDAPSPWWWLVAPYPIGWLGLLGLFYIRLFVRRG